MAVTTLGDMVQQLLDQTGETDADARSVRVAKASLNAAHYKICAIQDWDWLEAICTLAITATTMAITLPNGSTVTDTSDAVPAYCRNLLHVELVGTGTPLEHRGRVLDSIINGEISYAGRGVPSHWGTFGRALYLMPLPSNADSINLYYVAGPTALVADNAVPLLPLDFRQLLVEEAIANITSRAEIDPNAQARARDNAKMMLMSLRRSSDVAHPAFRTQASVNGQWS